MADPKDDLISPQDVGQWLQREVFEVMRAAELRVKEATGLFTEYATGKITPEEATQRMVDYDARWSPAMVPGINETMTNAQILRTQDAGRAEEAETKSKLLKALWLTSLSRGTSQENQRG